MKYKKSDNKIILRLDPGEEIIASIKELCQKENIKGGLITGIGATNRVKIGFFNPRTKKYQLQEHLAENYEIVSLIGNISMLDGEIYLHCHINLADENHKTFGGHLESAAVSATFEGVIRVFSDEIKRKNDHATGLNLLNL